MIEVNHLTKRYGGHTAVSDLSFTIEKGQIYGFLGPNGAGKSTTMNIMTGCLAATAGDVKIDGYDIFEQPMQAKRRIGYLPEQPPLYPDRTPREYLEFVAEAKGVAKTERGGQIRRVMELTGVTDVADRLCKNLSKGYRQRVGIAQALLGDPEIIILDEPTIGFDPKQIIEVRNLIRDLAKKHTVIFSSHILSEVQAVCDHILIINHGRLVANGTPAELERKLGDFSVDVTVKSVSAEAVKSALGAIDGVQSISTEKVENGEVSVNLKLADDKDIREAVYNACVRANLPILMLRSNDHSLEQIFLNLTREGSKMGLKRRKRKKIAAGGAGSAKSAAENSSDKEAK